MMSEAVTTTHNYFKLFGLESTYAIDIDDLRQRFIRLQSKFHPDKFVNQSPLEKRTAIKMATDLNDGYHILKDAVKRARYLASLNGISIPEEQTYQADPVFLCEQMELREQLEALQVSQKQQDIAAFYQQVNECLTTYYQTLSKAFNTKDSLDEDEVKQSIYEMQFYQKLMDEFRAVFGSNS